MEQDTGSKLYDISEEELVMEGPIISIDAVSYTHLDVYKRQLEYS